MLSFYLGHFYPWGTYRDINSRICWESWTESNGNCIWPYASIYLSIYNYYCFEEHRQFSFSLFPKLKPAHVSQISAFGSPGSLQNRPGTQEPWGLMQPRGPVLFPARRSFGHCVVGSFLGSVSVYVLTVGLLPQNLRSPCLLLRWPPHRCWWFPAKVVSLIAKELQTWIHCLLFRCAFIEASQVAQRWRIRLPSRRCRLKIPGSGRSPGGGNGNPPLLPREIPCSEEPGRLQSMGSQRVVSDLATTPLPHSFITPKAHTPRRVYIHTAI